MKQDERAFLENILANADDDAARLVYADYLEEVGDPRRVPPIPVFVDPHLEATRT